MLGVNVLAWAERQRALLVSRFQLGRNCGKVHDLIKLMRLPLFVLHKASLANNASLLVSC